MNTATFPKIAEALRAVAALLDEAADGAARAAAAQPELPVAAAPAEKPAPQGAAPEGIAPPADQVPAPGAAAAEASTTEQSSAVEQPPAPIQPSYDDAKAAVINLGKTLGREAITELLAGFNAKRLPEVPQDQLARVIAAANKRLEQHFFEGQEGAK